MATLKNQYDSQHFSNDYQLVNGVAMHAENPENFHIPPDVIKRHIRLGQFVEVRIDSPRFFIHEDAPEKCSCPSCNGEMTKPILRHSHPASLADGEDAPSTHRNFPSGVTSRESQSGRKARQPPSSMEPSTRTAPPFLSSQTI